MKIVHWGVFAPGQSGQYETAKDLIQAERLVGDNAQFVDYGWKDEAACRVGLVDGDLSTVNPHESDDADVLLRHSDIQKKFLIENKPFVMCLHGRPESAFLTGYRNNCKELKNESNNVLGIIKSQERNRSCVGFITFWNEYRGFWQQFLPTRTIDYVPAPVNLSLYTPEGSLYTFPKSGHPNIIITDMWREDVTPFNVLMAAIHYKKTINPDAMIHVYGIWKHDYRRAFLKQFINDGLIGDCLPFVRNLAIVYRSADVMVTPHVIATRTVREALASGLPFVGGGNSSYTKFNGDPRNVADYAGVIHDCWLEVQSNKETMRKDARAKAEQLFGYEKIGKAMHNVLDFCLNWENRL